MSIGSRMVSLLFVGTIVCSSQAQEIDKVQTASNYLACAANTAMVMGLAKKTGTPLSEEKNKKLRMLVGMYMVAGKNLTNEESMNKVFLEKTEVIVAALKSAKNSEELASHIATITNEMVKCSNEIVNDQVFLKIIKEESEK